MQENLQTFGCFLAYDPLTAALFSRLINTFRFLLFTLFTHSKKYCDRYLYLDRHRRHSIDLEETAAGGQ